MLGIKKHIEKKIKVKKVIITFYQKKLKKN